ncbi:MAG: manganese efflux pump [Spirulina sp. DLM2.Bin59]|nr:MAG: manganese efflux pump [Spirulina sp. DLM2.Bin59]
MEVLNLSLLSIGLAADAFSVSITSGLLIQRIKLNKVLTIALAFGLFQVLMFTMGGLMGFTVRPWINGLEHWIVFVLMSVIGGKMVYESIKAAGAGGEEERFNPTEIYTLLGLAIATSLDSLAAGIGVITIDDSLLFTAVIIGAVTFAFSACGVVLGNLVGRHFDLKAEMIGGLILIAIGLRTLWDHFVPSLS